MAWSPQSRAAAAAARKAKRSTITPVRKANQSDVSYQKSHPGTPVTRMPSRPRYAPNGQLRQKGQVGSRLKASMTNSSATHLAPTVKNYSSMSNSDKIAAAATMYGGGSKQHIAAKKKFGPTKRGK